MKTLYRMLADGEVEWQGKAYDAEHAEDLYFFHEEPSSLVTYQLQRWEPTLSPTVGRWVDV